MHYLLTDRYAPMSTVLRRKGADVYITQEVPLSQALLGTNITVPTIDGMVEVPVPACTQTGDKLRMRGRGIFSPRAGTKGDQYVEVKVAMPRNLTAKQKQLIADFEAEEKTKSGSGGKGSGWFR